MFFEPLLTRFIQLGDTVSTASADVSPAGSSDGWCGWLAFSSFEEADVSSPGQQIRGNSYPASGGLGDRTLENVEGVALVSYTPCVAGFAELGFSTSCDHSDLGPSEAGGAAHDCPGGDAIIGVQREQARGEWPAAADGGQYFVLQKTESFVVASLDAVSLEGVTAATAACSIFIGTGGLRGWEHDDYLRVWVTDLAPGGVAVNMLSSHDIGGLERLGEWQTVSANLSAALDMAGVGTARISVGLRSDDTAEFVAIDRCWIEAAAVGAPEAAGPAACDGTDVILQMPPALRGLPGIRQPTRSPARCGTAEEEEEEEDFLCFRVDAARSRGSSLPSDVV